MDREATVAVPRGSFLSYALTRYGKKGHERAPFACKSDVGSPFVDVTSSSQQTHVGVHSQCLTVRELCRHHHGWFGPIADAGCQRRCKAYGQWQSSDKAPAQFPIIN